MIQSMVVLGVFGSRKRWDRWHIIPKLAVYTVCIPLILPSAGLYATDPTFYGNQKQPLIQVGLLPVVSGVITPTSRMKFHLIYPFIRPFVWWL